MCFSLRPCHYKTRHAFSGKSPVHKLYHKHLPSLKRSYNSGKSHPQSIGTGNFSTTPTVIRYFCPSTSTVSSTCGSGLQSLCTHKTLFVYCNQLDTKLFFLNDIELLESKRAVSGFPFILKPGPIYTPLPGSHSAPLVEAHYIVQPFLAHRCLMSPLLTMITD